MSSQSFTLFTTEIGTCGIVWNDAGIVSVQLPEASAPATRQRVARRHPSAIESPPPPGIQRIIDDIVSLLGGEARDLSNVALDMRDITPFRQKLYVELRRIPAGATISYGELATRLGGCDARDVGEAMGKNPFPIIVPCHRVLGADGKPGGFSAPGGVATKLRMLNIERARVGSAPSLFDHLPLTTAPRRTGRAAP